MKSRLKRFSIKKFHCGNMKRSDLFLTSKLWCSFHRSDRVRQECLMTIDQFQCQYLDLFLIHWPLRFQDQVRDDLFVFV